MRRLCVEDFPPSPRDSPAGIFVILVNEQPAALWYESKRTMNQLVQPSRARRPASRFWRAVAHSPAVRRAFVWTMKRLFRLQIRNAESVPWPGPYIITGNHGSHYDLFLGLAAFCERTGELPVPVTWAGVSKIPVLGRILNGVPCVWVDRNRGADWQRLEVLRDMMAHLRTGRSLLIACEGERRGELGEFELGAALVSLHTGVPVLPVSLRGVQGLYSQLWRPKRLRGTVEIIVHAPMDPAVFAAGGDSRREMAARFTDAIRQQVAGGLDYPVQLSPPQ